MLKYYTLILIVCFTISSLSAQNLLFNDDFVENGDFESFTTLPDAGGQIARATGWFQMSNHQGSADYFHKNGTFQGQIRNNDDVAYGNQKPRSGRAYAGLKGPSLSDIDGVSCHQGEYMQTKLKRPLIKGVKYTASMFVSLGEKSHFASSNIGMAISQDRLTGDGTTCLLTRRVQVLELDVISEQDDWVEVSGTFIAQGGEEWLTIGGFVSDGADIEFTQMQGGGCCWDGRCFSFCNTAAFLIEDVSILELDLCEQECFSTNLEPSINGVINPTENEIPNFCHANNTLFFFRLSGTNFFTFKIFNRWGNKVWEMSDVDPCGFNNRLIFWNGFKSDNLNANRSLAGDTYVYVLEYSNCENSFLLTNEILLFSDNSPNLFTPPPSVSSCNESPSTCCVEKWEFNNDLLDIERTYKAETFITANNTDILPQFPSFNSDIEFQAGEFIELTANSSSEHLEIAPTSAVSSFEARIEHCNDVTFHSMTILDVNHTVRKNDLIERNISMELGAYPNPFHDNITVVIECNDPISSIGNLMLMDIGGRILLKKRLTLQNGKTELRPDFSNIPTGTYYLVLQTMDGSSITRKITKMQ